MRVRELIDRIERIADPRLAASWDRSGVQIAGTATDCGKLAVALEPRPDIVEAALAWGASCLLVHHPLTLSPRLPDRLDAYHRVLQLVLRQGAWLYAAHTSLDVVTDGPAGWLAEALDLENRILVEEAGRIPHVLTRVCAPRTEDRDHCLTRAAAFPRCRAMPMEACLAEIVHPKGAWPALWETLTAVCPDLTVVARVALAEPSDPYGYGQVGDLPDPMPFAALLKRLTALLPRSFFTMAGTPPETVRRLAYCPGSGADMAPAAFAAGAEVYLTGDLKYHQGTDVPAGRCIVDVGHFSLEEVMLRVFAGDLQRACGENGPTIRFFPGNDPFSAYFPEGALPPRKE